MTLLMRTRKDDLCHLVEKLGEETPEKATKIQLSKIIVEHSDYEEFMIKGLLEGIMTEGKNAKKKITRTGT